MDLSLRVEGVGLPPTTVAVTIDGPVSGRQLIDALAQHLGVHRPTSLWWWERTRTSLDGVVDLLSLEPRDGDVVILTSSAEGLPRPDADEIWLEGISGPSSGLRWNLPQGVTRIGRDGANDIVVVDDAVSRAHCRITRTDNSLSIEDRGSANGTFVDGTRIGEARPIADGSVIHIGETTFAVRCEARTVESAPRAETRWIDGTLLLNRPPRHLIAPLTAKTRLPSPPTTVAKRPFPLLAVIAPLVMAVVLFGVLSLGSGTRDRAWMSLLFGLMSPVMILGNVASERRQGGRAALAARNDYEHDIAAVEAELGRLAEQSRSNRLERAPETSLLASWCESTSPRLWERRPRDLDFLDLRIGLADRPTLLEIELPDASRDVDPDAVERNRALRERFGIDPSVPVTVNVDESRIVGVHGDPRSTVELVRSMVMQIAALHSPADVALVAVVPEDLEVELSWMRWLPHCAVLSSSATRTIVPVSAAPTILDRIDETIAARHAALEQHGSVIVRLPRIVLVLPDVDHLPAARLNRILSLGPPVGVLAIVAAGSAAALPGECEAVIGSGPAGCTVSWPLLGETIGGVTAEVVPADVCAAAAIGLAPLRDPSGTREAGLPASASYEDVIDFDPFDPAAIRMRWSNPDPSLSAPIGSTASGSFVVSLRRDGPHAVVAGTTGAGKSEFLQTLLASLAAHHSPERLSFVLVDLKGGAAFQDLARLPHTVGFFTDLDDHLAGRALLSLNAELRRREAILSAAGVKDLLEFEQRDPGSAPPSLLIAFDEFAVIKTEMPDFIEGIVDIARRGRSLGVHMVLATQSPTGVVDHHIRANTNLRIALRTANTQESQEIIERSSAADIPRTAHGRAWVRIGQDEPTLVQTAFSGRRSSGGGGAATVQVRSMGLSGPIGTVHLTAEAGVESPTDAQRLIEAVRRAADSVGIGPGPAPWLPPLPASVAAEQLGAGAADTERTLVPLGVIDEPERQSQAAFELDLTDGGNLVVYGTSGAGKTTLLRTLIGGLTKTRSPEECRFVIIDFASRGLRPLAVLPHVAAYVTDEDPSLLERVFARLEVEMSTRREVLASIGRSSLAEAHRAKELIETPEIVVIVDGLVPFINAYEDVDFGVVVDDLVRLASEGRSAGVHLIVTADRRNGVPMNLASGISERIVLRMTDIDDYLWLGIPEARSTTFVPGRGIVPGRGELQVALVGGEPDPRSQNETIVTEARMGEGRIERIEESASEITLSDPGSGPIPFAIEALTDRPLLLDLDELRWFLVVGPDRSGRSSTLALLADAWRTRNPHGDAYLVAPRRSPLRDQAWVESATTADGASELGRRIVGSFGSATGPILLVIDDGDLVAEGQFDSGLDQLLRMARDVELTVLAAAQTRGAVRAFTGWLRDLRDARNGLLLAPDVDRDGDVFGGRVPRRSGRSFPPGRGYLVAGDEHRYVQVVRSAD